MFIVNFGSSVFTSIQWDLGNSAWCTANTQIYIQHSQSKSIRIFFIKINEIIVAGNTRRRANSLCSSSATMSWRYIRRCGVHCCSDLITSGDRLRIRKIVILELNLFRSRCSLFKIVLGCAPGLIGELIALLDTMDDLNSAASSIMHLLAKLLASNSAEKYINRSL